MPFSRGTDCMIRIMINPDSAPWVNLNLCRHKRAMTLMPSLLLVGGVLIVVLRYGVR